MGFFQTTPTGEPSTLTLNDHIGELPASAKNGDVETVLAVVVQATKDSTQLTRTCTVPITRPAWFDFNKFRGAFRAEHAFDVWRLEYIKVDVDASTVDVRIVRDVHVLLQQIERKVSQWDRTTRTTLFFRGDCYKCDTDALVKLIEDRVPNAHVIVLERKDDYVTFDLVLNERRSAS